MEIPMKLNKKIKIGGGIIFIFYASLLLASGDRLIIQSESENSFECEAKITDHSTHFVFKEEKKYPDTILWKKNNIPDSVANTWLVFFQLENEDDIEINLHFSINLFDTKEVKFIDLLNDAEKVSFIYNDSAYFTLNYLDDNDLFPSVEGSNLTLTLKDQEIIALLLDHRPIAANFWILEENKTVRKCLTKIKYH